MRCLVFLFSLFLIVLPAWSSTEAEHLQLKVKQLQEQTQHVQKELNDLNRSLNKKAQQKETLKKTSGLKSSLPAVHDTSLSVHAFDGHPESVEFYPAALIADDHVVTYIAGMPVVTAPYIGSRPAFDGSDYIVNISSINRDIRLMQQRRRLYRAFNQMGYEPPNLPIIALSGKAEPIASIGRQYFGTSKTDISLASSELDVAAALNDKVQAYMAIAYDSSPPAMSGQRVANSSFNLNMGFVNIGDLEKTPYYFTAGQIFVPFGRFSSSMISAPLTMRLSRTKSRPFILGYKSQADTGPFAAVYGFTGDTTLNNAGVGGANLGYVFSATHGAGEIGASYISSINNAGGMQTTGSFAGTTFGGFGSITNGSENVKKIPGVGAHLSVSMDRYNITTEWVSVTDRFRTQDLSFNNTGAKPQAGQLEGAVTFIAFDRPSSLAADYQWSRQAVALNIPEQRFSGVFNISIWKDTVESLEYRHDINFAKNQYANGAAPPGAMNANTVSPGGATDTLLAQIGVYF